MLGATIYVQGCKYTVVHEFEYDGEELLVCRDAEEYFSVVRAHNAKRWEDTWAYKEEQEREQKLKKYREEAESLKKTIEDKVVKDLAMRMMLNSVFAKDGKYTQLGVVIGQEIRKLAQSELKVI